MAQNLHFEAVERHPLGDFTSTEDRTTRTTSTTTTPSIFTSINNGLPRTVSTTSSTDLQAAEATSMFFFVG